MPADDPVESAPLTESLRALARRGEVRRYRKGTVLIHEGDRGETLFVILQGRLRAFSANAEGKEITFGIYGPGEYLGEMSLDGGPRSASVVTVEAACCSVVTRQNLELHVAEHPGFAFELLSKVIRRARTATLSTKHLALNDVYGRLRELLNELAVPQADGRRLVAPGLTQQDIANRVGCSREMVSRLMKDLRQGGHLRMEGKALVLERPLPHRW